MEDTIKNYDPIKLMSVDDAVEQTLIDLAVNMLRVARGAGRPEDLCRQVIDCARSIMRHVDERKMLPDPQLIYNALHFTPDGPTPGPSKVGRVEASDRELAELVKGGLRVAAARLNRDHVQEYRGHSDLERAAKSWNAAVARKK